MAKSNASEMLTSLDSLFTTQEQRDEAKRDVVLDLPLDQIGDFPNHPFKVRQDDAMMEMMESVQLHGVLVPGLVRQLADGSYQMVSGHRRKLASRLAGLNTLPCIVRDLTDDEAIIVMVDSNLQREKVLPSEKAFAYKQDRFTFSLDAHYLLFLPLLLVLLLAGCIFHRRRVFRKKLAAIDAADDREAISMRYGYAVYLLRHSTIRPPEGAAEAAELNQKALFSTQEMTPEQRKKIDSFAVRVLDACKDSWTPWERIRYRLWNCLY